MAILGIDEVGRGPLAGPLVVGAVILPENKDYLAWVDELKDSKQLSERKRERLSEVILEEAPAHGLGWVWADELNRIGMAEGLRLATRRAVEQARERSVAFSEIVIDGNINFLEDTTLGEYTTTVVKGDNLIKEVSAASIIAKVARDRYMSEELDYHFPQYGFAQHKGYGTPQHLRALKEYGICGEHRLFCKPVARAAGRVVTHPERKYCKNTTKIGNRGEEAVRKYLQCRQHHQILMHNFKTKYCEIDIVSLKGNKIYFTEVKTRKNNSGLLAVTSKKLEQMAFAVQVFLDRHTPYREYDPVLAVATVNGKYKIIDWFSLDALMAATQDDEEDGEDDYDYLDAPF